MFFDFAACKTFNEKTLIEINCLFLKSGIYDQLIRKLGLYEGLVARIYLTSIKLK